MRAYGIVEIFEVDLDNNLYAWSINWGESEPAPHKWCIESKSLYSDGTAYVRTYVTLIVSAMVSSYTCLFSYL